MNQTSEIPIEHEKVVFSPTQLPLFRSLYCTAPYFMPIMLKTFAT